MTSPAVAPVSSPSWGLSSWFGERRRRRSETQRERAPGSWRLDADATLRLRPRAGGFVLRCHSGTLLVTQESDARDHVLGAGDELRMAGRGLVVVWALSQGELTVALARARNERESDLVSHGEATVMNGK
jgi:Protein of unknown function (DUF2917)